MLYYNRGLGNYYYILFNIVLYISNVCILKIVSYSKEKVLNLFIYEL
jgi:hypothetical protein